MARDQLTHLRDLAAQRDFRIGTAVHTGAFASAETILCLSSESWFTRNLGEVEVAPFSVYNTRLNSTLPAPKYGDHPHVSRRFAPWLGRT